MTPRVLEAIERGPQELRVCRDDDPSRFVYRMETPEEFATRIALLAAEDAAGICDKEYKHMCAAGTLQLAAGAACCAVTIRTAFGLGGTNGR